MSITLNGIVLPDDTLWPDEFGHNSVVQSVTRTLGGRQIIEEAGQSKGRAITLKAEWIDKDVLDQLEAEAAKVGNQMTLVHNSRTFTTMFRRGNGQPLEVTPVVDYPDYQSGDLFDVTINLFEV